MPAPRRASTRLLLLLRRDAAEHVARLRRLRAKTGVAHARPAPGRRRRCTCSPQAGLRASAATVCGLSPLMILTLDAGLGELPEGLLHLGPQLVARLMRPSGTRPAGSTRCGSSAGSPLRDAARGGSPAAERRAARAGRRRPIRRSAPAAVAAGAQRRRDHLRARRARRCRERRRRRRRPLHLRSEEKTTSATGGAALPPKAACSASIVRLALVVLAAKAPSSSLRSALGAPAAAAR